MKKFLRRNVKIQLLYHGGKWANSSYVTVLTVEFSKWLWKIFYNFVWMSYENQYIYNGLIFESNKIDYMYLQ
jgi:hypothetical protein